MSRDESQACRAHGLRLFDPPLEFGHSNTSHHTCHTENQRQPPGIASYIIFHHQIASFQIVHQRILSWLALPPAKKGNPRDGFDLFTSTKRTLELPTQRYLCLVFLKKSIRPIRVDQTSSPPRRRSELKHRITTPSRTRLTVRVPLIRSEISAIYSRLALHLCTYSSSPHQLLRLTRQLQL